MYRILMAAGCCAFLSTGAVAQQVDAYAIGTVGERIALSRVDLYRALGDRLVSGNDIVGNNLRNWAQVNPDLPDAPILLTVLNPDGDADLLRAVKAGCRADGQDAALCESVYLRTELLDREGMEWMNATLMPGMARFEGRVLPPPSAAITVPSMNRMVTRRYADGTSTVTVVANTATASAAPMPAPVVVIEAMPSIGGAAPAPVGRVYASRLFTGRTSFPPENFAAYGILAFDTLATGADRARYMAICEAFFGALVNSDDTGAPPEAQMVTAWPVDDRDDPDLAEALNTPRMGENSCDRAVDFYDVQIAQDAIDDARRAGVALSGRGPFLLAWAPAGNKGAPDAIVLAADMGGVRTASEAKDVLRIWRDDIERDPSLWQDGFTVEKLRVTLRRIVNRYGDGLLKFFGG